MSISSITCKCSYPADGNTRIWPFDFTIWKAEQIQVYIASSGGEETLLTSGYEVNLTERQVIYPTVASGLSLLEPGQTITLIRATDLTQPIHLYQNGKLDPEELENGYDKLTMHVQELAERTSRCIQYPVSSGKTNVNADAFLADLAQAQTTVLTGALASVTDTKNEMQQAVATETALREQADQALQNALNTKQNSLSADQLAAVNSGANGSNIGQISLNQTAIAALEAKIPSQANAMNQLADKAFVNSSIATNTANFIGTFTSVEDLEAYSGTLTNNDYAFVETTDQAGNTLYKRYKYNGTAWVFEYELNNSSFTAAQFAALNSGITVAGVAQIGANETAITGLQNTKLDSATAASTYATQTALTQGLATKQDVISDLGDIRSGALAGATALQPATAAATYVANTQKGVANGVASLDANGQIAAGQINYATSERVGGIKQSFDGTTGTWTVTVEEV